MWQHYRKTLPANEIFIVIVCILMAVVVRANAVTVAAVFAVMQVGLIAGAAWATRLRRRIAAARSTLPLQRRKI